MKRILAISTFFLVGILSMAQDIPERPNPPTLVTDFANIIDDGAESAMEQKLVDYFASTSTQIAVVTITDLQGYEVSDFAFRMGEKWGIGSQKFDNGILILVKPKTSESRGQVFIAPGYGLEGSVPDATANQIVENEMIPLFKSGDMTGGIDRAIDVLIELTKGEYNYQQYAKQHEKGKGGAFPFFVIILIIFFIITRLRRSSYYSAGGKSNLPFWIAMGMMSSAGNRNHSGLYNNFSNGSGLFGGGGGSSFGSFGGFGGGSFGGGGAGGSW